MKLTVVLNCSVFALVLVPSPTGYGPGEIMKLLLMFSLNPTPLSAGAAGEYVRWEYYSAPGDVGSVVFAAGIDGEEPVVLLDADVLDGFVGRHVRAGVHSAGYLNHLYRK